MSQLTSFTFISLDGYYKGQYEDISWHQHGGEEAAYSKEGLKTKNTLLFGRVTYEMMAGFWPTQMAMDMDAEVATGMNNANKIVFSRTMQKADWQNTTIIKDDIITKMKQLKRADGNNMTLLGSGNILTQFADHNLIDEYLVMIDPIAIGEGTSIFKGLQNKLKLKLTSTRTFNSGVVLLSYEPR